jgi:hypothetical protein
MASFLVKKYYICYFISCNILADVVSSAYNVTLYFLNKIASLLPFIDKRPSFQIFIRSCLLFAGIFLRK